MADNLFGTLHTPLKPINYSGIDTDTIGMIVNSEDRTISAHLQPKITEVISSNVEALKSAYNKLVELNDEIDKVEKVITNIYSELNANIHKLKQDTTKIFEKIDNIENEYDSQISNIKSDYATKVFVSQAIDDKILELQEGEVNLTTYAKVDDVEKEFTRVDNEIRTKVDISTFEDFANNTLESISDINNSLDITINKIDVFESAIGPLPQDKTLQEEIFETFATKTELEYVQNVAGNNSVLIRSIDSELVDINKALEDCASKDYVREEISKIELPGIDLSNYYTREETYNREEIDSKIINAGGGSPADLSNYFTKAQTLTEIDNAIRSIDTIIATI